MAKTTKLTVATDVGTFTRKTVRTYTHLVLVKGFRAEVLEASRQRELESQLEQAARYAAIQEGIRSDVRPSCVDFDTRFQNEHRASGDYGKWATECCAHAARLQ